MKEEYKSSCSCKQFPKCRDIFPGEKSQHLVISYVLILTVLVNQISATNIHNSAIE